MNGHLPSQVLRAVALDGAPRRLERRRPATLAAMDPAHVAPPASGIASADGLATSSASVEAEASARGYASGFERGFKEGMAAAEAKIAEAARQAASAAQAEVAAAGAAERKKMEAASAERGALIMRVLEQVQKRVDDGLRQLEEDAFALAFEAVCRVIGNAAPAPDTVKAVVVAALTQLHDKPAARIRLHPDDLAALRADVPAASLLSRYPGVAWEADEGIAIGGCLVDTAAGTLDARLETQLRNLGAVWRQAASTTGANRPSEGAGGPTS